MNKQIIQVFVKLILITVFSASIGVVLLSLVHMIPIENIKINVNESIYIFKNEREYPKLLKYCTSQLDNFTDAIMLSTAVYEGNESQIEKTLMNYRIVNNKDKATSTPVSDIIDYHTGKVGNYNKVSYARYWHGYLIFLKPLLTIFNYREIRLLNVIIQTILNVVVAALMYNKNMKQYIVPYLLSVCAIMPIATAFSMQFSDIFYIFSIASIILLIFESKWYTKENYFIFFNIIGILTAFFDLLTYPLVTFGIPVIIYVCLKNKENSLENIKDMMKFIICWGIGYVGMWGCKWIIATLLTDTNVIQDAILSVFNRTSVKTVGNNISITDVLFYNIQAFLCTPITFLMLFYVISKVFKIIKCKIKSDKINIIMFIIICMLPICWYIFASGHSGIHYWFTNKTLIITAFALMSFLAKTTNE